MFWCEYLERWCSVWNCDKLVCEFDGRNGEENETD